MSIVGALEDLDAYLACTYGFVSAARDIREGKARYDPKPDVDDVDDEPEMLHAFRVGYEKACVAYRLGNDPMAMAEANQFQVDPKMAHELVAELLDGTRHTRPDPRTEKRS